MSSRAKDIIEVTNANGWMASQAMFGDAVFVIAPHCQEFTIYEALQEFGQVLEYNISTCVPKLIHE